MEFKLKEGWAQRKLKGDRVGVVGKGGQSWCCR